MSSKADLSAGRSDVWHGSDAPVITRGRSRYRKRLPTRLENPSGPHERLPDCFEDHHAPQSVIDLFTLWVREADTKETGIIMINRRCQIYSAINTFRVLTWLMSHNLMVRTEIGGKKKGNGSRYFVRWSFNHKTLCVRRNVVNCIPPAKPETSSEVGSDEGLPSLDVDPVVCVPSLEEDQKLIFRARGKELENVIPSNQISKEKKKNKIKKLSIKNHDPMQGPDFSKKNQSFQTDKKKRNEKAIRWSLAQIRKITDDRDVITAVAVALRRVLAAGKVFVGAELAEVVSTLISKLPEQLESRELDWVEFPRGLFAYVGHVVNAECYALQDIREMGLECSHLRRRNLAEDWI